MIVDVGAPFMGARYARWPSEFETLKWIRNRVTTRDYPYGYLLIFI